VFDLKKSLLATVVIAASLTVAGCEVLQKDAYDYKNEVQSSELLDESTNGIGLRDSSEKVEKNLGKPKKIEKSDSITHLTYGNDELLLTLDDNIVVEYQINSKAYQTGKGIKVGNSKDEVIQQYGSNYYTNKEDKKYESIGYFDKESNRHIEFFLKNNQVINIKVVDIS
jgi:hypothetical protein